MPTDYFGALQESERRQVGARYSGLRQAMEKSLRRRGIERSGFAGEAHTKLGAEEAGALSDVQAGVTDRLQNYRMQQEQLAAMKAMSKKKKKKGGWLGKALGVAAPIVGGMFGGIFG